MKLHPRVSQPAVDLVKRFEGFRPRAAKTPDGRFTIGYGHLLSLRDSAEEAAISEAEAEFLLKHDLSVIAEAVEEALLAPVNDNQFAALLSFAFNIGVDNFKGCSAVRHLNQGAYLQAAAAIELWRRADFNGDALVVDQLVRRRAVEKALFLAPPEGFMPLPSSVLRPAFDHSVIGAAVAWAAARERTAVSRIALDGALTSADLVTPPGREGEPAPSAAIAAADALTMRLSRILPDDEPQEEVEQTPAAAEPLALEAEPAPAAFSAPDVAAPERSAPEPVTHGWAAFEPEPERAPQPASSWTEEAAADGAAKPAAPARLRFTDEPVVPPLAFSGEAAVAVPAPRSFDSGFDLPPPPVQFSPSLPSPSKAAPAPHAETTAPLSTFDSLDFGGPSEPQAHFDRAEHAAEPPPLVAELQDAAASGDDVPVSPWRRRFAARPEVVAYVPPGMEEPPAPTLFDAPAAPPTTPAAASPFEEAFRRAPLSLDSQEAEPGPAPTPLFERPMFFVILGLIGIALFAGSIFCMMNRASFTCLLIGVVGVLAMAPAAAFFLFRFLGNPVDPASEEHASLTQMASLDAQTAPAAHALPAATNEAAPAAAADSPFDSAWR